MYIKQTWEDAIVDEHGNVIKTGTLITKERMDHIEQGIYGQGNDDIDCGLFTDPISDPIKMHNAAAATHQNLNVDGNIVRQTPTSNSLSDHQTDPLAHQNLNVDGNI